MTKIIKKNGIKNKSESKSESKLDKLAAFEQKIMGTKKIIVKAKILKTSKNSTLDKSTHNKFKPKSIKTEKKVEKKIEKKIEKKKTESCNSEKNTVKKTKPKKKKAPRQLIFTVCNSKKSCGENYGPYIWERVCNENNKDIKIEEFEKNGITFKKSHVCQGRCKKASNIRVAEPAKDKTTQFSYMTPLKAIKLAKSLQSGAAPENIKKL